VFRIEDTDASRATEDSMRSMMEAMAWIGLAWDEGPVLDADGSLGSRGAHGPYRQSERTALYAAVARRLEAVGATYRDHRTAEELEAWREEHRTGKGEGPPVVKASTFEHTADELERFAAEGRPGLAAAADPRGGSVTVHDLVRGEVRWDWAQISDPVIARSDGSATYPLANSVDDVAQGISLICRGEDLLSVTPRQVLLYDLLTGPDPDEPARRCSTRRWPRSASPPASPDWGPPAAFAHLPMVVGMDRKKLSKRHGSVAIQEFAQQGFLPETLRNYLALLGWAPKDGRERLTDAELQAEFDLDAVGKAAAAFDVDKLTAFNGERIRDLDPDELADLLVPFLDGTYGDEVLVDSPATDRRSARCCGARPARPGAHAAARRGPALRPGLPARRGRARPRQRREGVRQGRVRRGDRGRRAGARRRRLDRRGDRGGAARAARGARRRLRQGRPADPGRGDRVVGQPAAVRVHRAAPARAGARAAAGGPPGRP
jgi:glutamyl/glutaminyl-tRNA synthetase